MNNLWNTKRDRLFTLCTKVYAYMLRKSIKLQTTQNLSKSKNIYDNKTE